MENEEFSVLVFGDQLNSDISSIRSSGTKNILMVESTKKCASGKWHKRRVAFVISAMRHFKDILKDEGFNVDYHEWADDFTSPVKEHIENNDIKKLFVMKPINREGIRFVNSLSNIKGVTIEVTENDMFMCPEKEFAIWLKKHRSPIMENFYRMMRKTRKVLMDGNDPAGGKWNFDKENREKPKKGLKYPETPVFKDDKTTKKVIEDVNDKFPDNFGKLDSLEVPVDIKGSLRYIKDFIDNKLENFGPYEDAMLSGKMVMYHSRASILMNVGLLHPEECVRMAEKAYHDKKVPINSAEGYVRQIMGWREYMAGMYTATSSEILSYNYLNCKKSLPSFYWDETITDMNCLYNAVRSVRETGYTHHIVRLMILGNFALIAGIDPKEVSGWFLETYEDAYEWVVTPNVICMSQFADGGNIATKPYASSANYINKMSDYCKGCKYSPNEKLKENACPFNYLYWDFLKRNRKQLEKTGRMGLAYNLLDKQDPDTIKGYMKKSKEFLDSLKTRRKY